MKIVLASNNKGKLDELQAMFAPLGVELLTQASLGIPEAPEPHRTFVENALAKARNAAQHSGLPAIADDAGLCVDASSFSTSKLPLSSALAAQAAQTPTTPITIVMIATTFHRHPRLLTIRCAPFIAPFMPAPASAL